MNNNTDDIFINYLRYYYDNLTPNLTLIFLLIFAIGLVISFSGKIEKTDKKVIDLIVIYLKKTIIPIILLCGLGSYILAFIFAHIELPEEIANRYMHNINENLFNYFSSAVNYLVIIPIIILPIVLHFLFNRFVVPHISALLRSLRITQSEEKLSDILDEIKNLKPLNYDPTLYFVIGKLFLGLTIHNKPIYVDLDFFVKNHLKIVGPSQVGKGVVVGLLLEQFIMNNWLTWFSDIKPDDFIYPILKQACKKYKRNLVVVDLTGQYEGKGYSPFLNGSDKNRLTRLMKALKIEDTGTNADYYLSKNRLALYKVFHLWNGDIEQLLKLLSGKDARIDEAENMIINDSSINIRTRLNEWLMYDSIKAKGDDNFNILESIKNNDVVYIRGSMSNPVIRSFHMALIEELIQVVLDNNIKNRIFLAIDEAKFLITDTLANALATVLSKGITMCLTYQAKNDTANPVDRTANALSMQNAIETNTQFSIYYRAIDPETAEWVAKQTGTTNITVTRMEKVNTNSAGAEIWDNTRMLSQEQQYLIPENVIKTLPPMTGVLVMPNKLAQIVRTCWVPLNDISGLPEKETDKENKKTNENKCSTSNTSNVTPPNENKKKKIKKKNTNDETQADLLFNQIIQNQEVKQKNNVNNKEKNQGYIGIDEL